MTITNIGWLHQFDTYKFTGILNVECEHEIVYYEDGVMHREDGPALIWREGEFFWYLFGRQYSKEEWFSRLTLGQKMVALYNPENW